MEKSNLDIYNIIQIIGNLKPGYPATSTRLDPVNRLRTGHGCFKELLYKWKIGRPPRLWLRTSQTIYHVQKYCPIRVFKGSMIEYHDATDEAINWIKALDIRLYRGMQHYFLVYILQLPKIYSFYLIFNFFGVVK